MKNFLSGKESDLRFELIGTLSAPDEFGSLVTASMGCDGPIAIWATEEGRAVLLELDVEEDQPPGGPTVPSGPVRCAVASYSQQSMVPMSVVVVELRISYPLIQSLPAGEVLIVGARCEWSESGPQKNALVFGDDGTLKRSGTLGDGIEHLLADSAGNIWTGYSDEGIFGNYGWGGPGPRPLGSSGIVQWSSEFEAVWRYKAVDDYWLADCYALNVGHDLVWACPYTDFPVLEIDDGRTSVHPTLGVSGPRGIVVAGEWVGIIGDYMNPGTLRFGSLRGGPDRLEKRVLRMPGGRQVPRGELVCRGSIATLFVDGDWLSFDLSLVV